MAELLKVMQSTNEAFKSDLLKSFVTDSRGQVPQADVGGTTTGAGFFFPASPPPAPSSTPITTATTTTATTTAASSPPPPGSADPDNANVLIQEARTDNVQTGNNGNPGDSNQNTLNANRPPTATTTTATTTAASPTASSTTTSTTSEEPDPNANMSEVAAVLEQVRQSPGSETREMLVGQVREAAVDGHLATCINTLQAVQDARARFLAMKEAGQLPDMSKLSLSAGAMWEKMTEQMMPEVGKTINFFKLLPGFSELCLDDQMLLIKQGTFEVMMTRFCLLIDHEKETMLDPSHKMVCPRQVVQEMPMGKFLDGFFRVAARFNPIGLKDNEVGVFTAVLALSPNRPGLKEARLVGTIQSLYLHALFSLMKQNHSDPETRFSQVLALAPMFRRMSEEHSKALGTMKMQAPEAFNKQFAPLHKEIYSPEH